MSIVALFSGSYCNAGEIAAEVSRRLGYEHLGEEAILDGASEKYDVARDRFERTLYGPPPFFKGFGQDRGLNVAYMRTVLAGRIGGDNIVYRGFTMHLLPRSITHVLRVCLVADQSYKAKAAMEQEGISEKESQSIVKKDDRGQSEWVRYLLQCGPWDKNLYDIMIPMHSHTVESAADLICANAQKKVLEITPQSQKAVEDFVLAAQVYLPLARKWPDVEVSCDDGVVTLVINESAVRLESLKKKLTEIAGSVPGVKSAQASVGPRFKKASIYRDYDFELPSKVLLVDDEKEFVETLSERLQAREMESSVAYNGEDALSQVEQDEPEVMVLDLKMPGIDGMEVLRKVKQERPDVEVIVLTGHGSEQDMALAKELGAFAYLRKPVDIEVLTQTMKAAYRKMHGDESAGENSDTDTE